MPRKITRRQAPASVPFRAADLLQSEAEIVAYIDEMLADGDDRVLPIALRTVRDALLGLQRFREAGDASGITCPVDAGPKA